MSLQFKIVAMNIVFFHRNPKCGFSIYKVFSTIIDELKKTNSISEYFVPSHRADFASILKNMAYVYKNRSKKGINHISGDIQYCIIALMGCKSVLTIHDMSAYDHSKNPVKKIIIKWLWFKLPLLIADKVVCISEHTKSELLKMCDRKDIEVIYNAVDPTFKINLKEFNVQKPNILQIGTAWNKNLERVIHAIATIPCRLIIVGSVDQSIIDLMTSKEISYQVKTGLSDAALLEEYNNCDIISFCSLFEGFGMPIIEGNAVGRCVVTSNLNPMLGIAKDAACFVDPNDEDSITVGFKKIIDNSVFRDNLIDKGINNIKRFNVINIAASYENIYFQVI